MLARHPSRNFVRKKQARLLQVRNARVDGPLEGEAGQHQDA